MGKSDQGQVKSQANQAITTNTANQDKTNAQLQGILGTAQGNANSLYGGLTGGYSDMASTGGYDPSVLGTINKTYGDLATTGGISAADSTAMKNQAMDTARSGYQTAAADAGRALSATGAYGMSGSIVGNLARKGSQAAATASENVEGSLAGLKQQGQEAGAAGLGQTQQNLTSNKLAGLQGNTNIYGMNEQQMNTTVSQILQNYQQTGQLNNQDLAILTNLANQPGMYDKMISTLGSLSSDFANATQGIKNLAPEKVK